MLVGVFRGVSGGGGVGACAWGEGGGRGSGRVGR